MAVHTVPVDTCAACQPLLISRCMGLRPARPLEDVRAVSPGAVQSVLCSPSLSTLLSIDCNQRSLFLPGPSRTCWVECEIEYDLFWLRVTDVDPALGPSADFEIIVKSIQ